jgi:hypothetical protein
LGRDHHRRIRLCDRIGDRAAGAVSPRADKTETPSEIKRELTDEENAAVAGGNLPE